MHEPRRETVKAVPAGLKFIKGKAASEGIAYGPSMILAKENTLALVLNQDFGRKYSLDDFRAAVAATERQLEEMQEQVEHKLSDAASLIFAAHLMILKDKEFVGKITGRIESGVNAPAAVAGVAADYMKGFLASNNAYMREKINDIEDFAAPSSTTSSAKASR